MAAQLNGELRKAMTPGLRAELTMINLILVGHVPDEFTAFVKAHCATRANIVNQAGIQPQ
jgi:tripartite-type tricarboxylate transporter receptor subunit TctC